MVYDSCKLSVEEQLKPGVSQCVELEMVVAVGHNKLTDRSRDLTTKCLRSAGGPGVDGGVCSSDTVLGPDPHLE